MTHVSAAPLSFWDTVAARVAAKVTPALRQGANAREPIIAYLRDLEDIARFECDNRQTIQIIASGRRLLGDRSDVDPIVGPFSRT